MKHPERPRELRIDHLTSDEIARAIAAGACTAILPLGAIEQHGPHLPLSVDSDHADALALRIAERFGTALVLPTVRVGCSPHHLGFAGTLSVHPSTLEAICLDYCSSLAAHGFARAVLFSGHIGNYPIMRDFEPRLAAALAPTLQVIIYGDSAAILDAWRKSAQSVAGLGSCVGGHADVAETSVMLVLHPERVRADHAAAGYRGTVDEEFLHRTFVEGIESVSPNGVLGDPTGSSTSIGHAALDAVTDLIPEYVIAHGA
ncbi:MULTISPECIES: creatininase family protein [Bradyrhizobium]|uniref:Creatininase family protein n=1 Tax=Bradyrhizobium elkanii TaxID=29448 RepID=A0A4U6S0I5_BRAEL|nr:MULTISPECIES: creatininase family protein [Bradyrhizobium]MTV14036.1 creatininase family protein [Bradyrhizobium sp. BR2003]TKV80348.1 creatininase family protein [Bradyrhizobium elkanii]